MVRETQLAADDFIYPLFVTHGRKVKNEIKSMPGVFQWSPDLLAREAESIASLGIPSVILFGIPESKDPIGLENFSANGIVQQATRIIKEGGAGDDRRHRCVFVRIHRSRSLRNLEQRKRDTVRIHTYLKAMSSTTKRWKCWRKWRCPMPRRARTSSRHQGMIDGMVAAIRSALDANSFDHLPILSYSTKYASGFYGPFRDAAQGAPKFGDRKTHQMDPANAREALRETAMDVAEGAGHA